MPSFNKKRSGTLDKAIAFLKRHLLAIIVVVVFVAGIIATVMIVNRDEGHDNGDEGSIAILQPASEVRLAMYEPSSFDPLASSDEDVVYLNNIIYSYLFRLDANLNIVPDIVESYIPNRETGSVELILRDGLTFSDGTAMNAYDVEFTIHKIRNVGPTSPYFNYISKISSVFVTGKNSLFIEFESPENAALDNLVFPIVSADTYNDMVFNIGGGPYKFEDYSEGKTLDLSPNERYYGEVPTVSVHIGIVKNKDILPGLTTMDDVTAYMSKASSADDIAIDKSLRCRYIPSGELEYLGFNCKNRFLSNSQVRFAISCAIDRDTIIKDDYANSCVVSDSLYYPGFMDVVDESAIKYDPKKSSEILASLGYVDTNEDKILEDDFGEPLTLTLIVSRESGNRRDAASTIAKNLNSIGISVEVIQLNQEELLTVLEAGSFDMYFVGMKIDKQFNISELFGEANFGKYYNETVMKLVGELEQCLSREEQKGVFTALKPLLNTDIPYFSIGYRTYAFVSVQSLAVKENPTFFDPYRDIQYWAWQKRVSQEE